MRLRKGGIVLSRIKIHEHIKYFPKERYTYIPDELALDGNNFIDVLSLICKLVSVIDCGIYELKGCSAWLDICD